MSDVFFYHLTEMTLEQALPGLLERCLERNWRVVVQAGSPERCEALNEHLWTYSNESFLPHAVEGAAPGDPADHPIWITMGEGNPNSANVRFLVDGAEPNHMDVYERVVIMFDGMDEHAVVKARETWKAQKSAGHDVTYWKQEEGRWVKKA